MFKIIVVACICLQDAFFAIFLPHYPRYSFAAEPTLRISWQNLVLFASLDAGLHNVGKRLQYKSEILVRSIYYFIYHFYCDEPFLT
jgi:hypothetical protein